MLNIIFFFNLKQHSYVLASTWAELSGYKAVSQAASVELLAGTMQDRLGDSWSLCFTSVLRWAAAEIKRHFLSWF